MYRTYLVISDENSQNHTPTVPHPLGNILKSEYPGFEKMARCFFTGKEFQATTYDKSEIDKRLLVDNIAFADPEMLHLLELSWKAGTGDLGQPGQVVISVSAAEKLFGLSDGNHQEAVGRKVVFEQRHTALVAGVYEDIPEQSDFPFDMVLPYDAQKDLNEYYRDGTLWPQLNGGTNIYMKLPEDADVQTVANTLDSYFQQHNQIEGATLRLQSLTDLHYDPRLGNYSGYTFDRDITTILVAIGFLILFTSCINFINLNTARTSTRFKEIGVRKVMGSGVGELIFFGLMETLILVAVAIVISLALSELMFIGLDNLVDISIRLSDFSPLWLLGLCMSLLIGITVASGLFPAWKLSKISAVTAINSRVESSASGSKWSLRRILVVLQFAISMALVMGTIVIVSQQSFVLNKDMGFVKDGVINIVLPQQDAEKINVLKNELLTLPGVASVSANLGDPISGTNNTNLIKYLETGQELDFNSKSVDEAYLDLFGIELLAGENISASAPDNHYVITKSSAERLGFQNFRDAVGQSLQDRWDNQYYIRGVAEDFYTQSLAQGTMGVILSYNEQGFYNLSVRFDKVQVSDLAGIIDDVEEVYYDVFPAYLFQYGFLDQQVKERYQLERIFSRLFQVFAAFALIIGALGLYGLVDFMAIRKTKEIGILKVMGADVINIVSIFIKEIGLLVAIASLLAIPAMVYILNLWLESYVERINIGPLIIISTIISVLGIAVMTTFYRSLKAAIINPVDTLKDE
jgi:ABC-type antimicrobial peptide transport system permease subunit